MDDKSGTASRRRTADVHRYERRRTRRRCVRRPGASRRAAAARWRPERDSRGAAQRRRSSAAGFYAVTADLRGHGESGWDPAGDYTLSAHMGDVERWCARNSIVRRSSARRSAGWRRCGPRAQEASRGQESAGSCLVLVDIAHRADADGVARIRALHARQSRGVRQHRRGGRCGCGLSPASSAAGRHQWLGPQPTTR